MTETAVFGWAVFGDAVFGSDENPALINLSLTSNVTNEISLVSAVCKTINL